MWSSRRGLKDACCLRKKDFGDLIFRRGRTVPGIVLMRLGAENARLQEMRLIAAIERFGERLLGQYVVVEEGRFRARPLRNDES